MRMQRCKFCGENVVVAIYDGEEKVCEKRPSIYEGLSDEDIQLHTCKLGKTSMEDKE